MRKGIVLFLLVLAGVGTVVAQTAAVDITITVSDGSGGTQQLRFGLDPSATDGIDASLGELELPPMPPSGVFDARFTGEDIGIVLGQGVLKDYRQGSATTSGTRIHEVRYQVGTGSTITVSWSLPAGVSGQLQDVITGSLIDQVMSGSGSYTITNPAGFSKLRMTITYSGGPLPSCYVNNVTGSDTNNGSVGAPKRTIQNAILSVSAGGTISVTNTGQLYDEVVAVTGKALTFTSSGGAPEIANLVVNLTGLVSNQISFTGPFKIRTLDLSEGAVQSASLITISSGGKIIRRSSSATLSQQPNYEGPVDVEYSGQASITTGSELPSTVRDLTVTRNTNVPNFTTVLASSVTISRLLTVRNDLGAAPASSISIAGDLIVTIDGNYSASMLPSFEHLQVPLNFVGEANQNVTIPSTGATIGFITINKSNSAKKVTITGGDLTCTGTVTFVNGLFCTGTSNALVLHGNRAGSVVTGFVRDIGAGSRSHVVGNVKVALKTGSIIAFGRNEFPVGDETYYRPAAISIVNPAAGNMMIGISATVNYDKTRPTGIVGLPILNGVAPGVDIARYPDFSWFIMTTGSLGQTQFNLELTAEGYSDFDDVANVRIIRRSGTVADIANTWSMQGTQYDNYIISGVPTVVNVNSIGGLIPGGAIYTYGVKTTMVVANPILDVKLTDASKTFTRNLTNPALFTGAKAAISYSATIDNPAVATAMIANNILTVTLKVSGTTFITVTGTDAFDGGRISHRVNVQCVSNVGDKLAVVPTEFSLSQNYPNPFNPATTIQYDLPKPGIVTLVVYNMLGQVMAKLVGQQQNPGTYKVVWDASNVTSGIYVYRLQAGEFVETKKMILAR